MGELARVQTSTDAVPWSQQQLTILKRDLGIKNDADLAYFGQVCSHKNLDPFLGEIVPVYYAGQMDIQETVEGLRTFAERSGLYGGFVGPYWCGPDEKWHDIWLSDKPPAGAKHGVRRKDWDEIAWGVATWSSCAQFDSKGNLMPLWKSRPDEMLGKTAEARALKRAFAKEFARAGVDPRILTDAQQVVVEAKRVGLDDDGRHELIAEVTGGRTSSSRDLTDDERQAVRAEIARRADPDTGEVPTSPAPHVVGDPAVQGGPGGSTAVIRCTTCDWMDAANNRDEARRRGAIHRLREHLNSLGGDDRRAIRAWMADRDLHDLDDLTLGEVDDIEAELDRRAL